MTKQKTTKSAEKLVKRPPASSPEQREKQLIAMAYDAAEQQLASGTASAQVITHFLKLATEKEKLEREKLQRENALLASKKEMIDSAQRVEVLYKEALDAMRLYSGAHEE